MTEEDRVDLPKGRMTKAQAIASDLARKIAAGAFQETGQLPTEPVLAAAYKVSRSTIQGVLRDLAAAELVERRHGSGTYIRQAARPKATVSRALRRQAGRITGGDGLTGREGSMVSDETISGAEAVYLARDEQDDDQAITVTRIVTDEAGGRCMHRVVIPMDLSATTPDVVNRPDRPVTELFTDLAAAGAAVEVCDYVSVRAALPADAEALGVDPAAPLLVTYRVASADARPLILEVLTTTAATRLTYPVLAPRRTASV